MGLVLTLLLLLRGLPLRLLWLRNHLVYHLLRYGSYTYAYAYDIRMHARFIKITINQ